MKSTLLEDGWEDETNDRSTNGPNGRPQNGQNDELESFNNFF